LGHVAFCPQLSVTVPHATPVQDVVRSCVQHMPLLHSWPALQLLQATIWPQLFFTLLPHWIPAFAHVVAAGSGVQHAPWLHSWPGAQVLGHVTLLPQLSVAIPPHATLAQVIDIALGVQQVLLTHVPVAHCPPQFTVSPQASFTVPHVAPLLEHRVVSLSTGLQAPATHSSPVGQFPHARIPPHPSLIAPQVTPVGQAVIFLQAPHWKVSASHT
jgi:hypothetical protein